MSLPDPGGRFAVSVSPRESRVTARMYVSCLIVKAV